jgi:translation initiation factor 3 subunit B
LLQTDIYSWLLDKRGRDQFLIQYKNENEVCWNDSKKGEAEVSFSRSFWTEGPLTWSPHGTYLATLHRQGVVLWASRADGDFIKVTRFACPDVQMLTFSAHEEYITLFSVQPQGPREPPMVTMSVCDCRSGMKLRVLRESLDTLLVGSMNVNANRMRVPFLSWSPAKPALCAKMMHDAVQVRSAAPCAQNA